MSSDPTATTAAAATSASATSTHPLESISPPAPAPAPAAAGDAGVIGSATPPEPMVHVRALVISGQNHVFNFDPEITVGRMKELVWSMWPSDWTEPTQPPSPSYLRILHAGRILQDDTTLSSNNLPVATAPTNPTVIHISVRSYSIRAEDDPKKGSNLHPSRTRSRGAGQDEVGGCKCIIM